MEKLDDALAAADCSAYVVYASSADADFRYLTGFQVSDPLLYLKKKGETGLLVVPQMEYERAATESSAVPVTRAESGFLKFLEEEKDPWQALARTITSLAEGQVMVPRGFPYWLGKLLEEHGGVVADGNGVVHSMRAVKTSLELAAIRAAQKETETAMALGISMIRRSVPREGVLYFEDAPLTSDRVRTAMHTYLMERGYTARDTIVSCGEETAMPHRQGESALLEDEPIVIDLFPQHDRSGYHADMTRTIVKGEPSPEIAEMHAVTCEAVDLGESLIAAGVEGSAVHNAVADLYKEQGYESGARGFVHSLGHGVGLEVHEGPSLSPAGGPLEAGNVVTVEPGLYYPGIGGVRVEDMGAVTQSGFDCFTHYTRELVL